MSAIFLAFANTPENRLPTLAQEDDQVYALLSRRAAQQHFTLHRDSSATIGKIAEYLILYRDTLDVFLYSGHAEKDALLLEDDSARAEGIAQLLGQCPNLKLIILNGCSTAGQVERLLQLPNQPIVIATSAPVNDFAATQFSIRFFQALSEQFATIESAFQAGLGAAQMSSQAATRAGRQQLTMTDVKEPVWGVYYNPAAESKLAWTLPSAFVLPATAEPNAYLIRTMIEVFAPYDLLAMQIQQDEARGKKRNLADKREVILQCLPHPVSEQLRRLLVPGQAGYGAVFYDKLGVDRLRQITTTYNTIIELTAYVMLSQLWNALFSKALQIDAAQRQLLQQFFLLKYDERSTYDFFPLIKAIREIFDQNGVTYFVEELTDVSQTFNEHSDFYNACMFLETLKRRFAQRFQFEKNEADQLCIVAEEKLTAVMQQLGFLARYTMASVKDIDVLKYRHRATPLFRHKVVELVQRLGGLAEETQELEQFWDNSSVLLQHKGEESSFLNLSPFIIDENAFVEKAQESKLYFYHHYEKAADVFCFKHIYKPDDPLLMVSNQENYQVIKDQFEAFAELLFQKPLRAL
ncbi:MAG: hypothetical protein ACK4TA_15970 [Saprospiraceae bacterium]